VLAGMFLFRFKDFGSINFRVQAMGILMTWMVLFSNAADTHTYLISMLGYVLWYWSRWNENSQFDKILFYSLLLVVIIVPIDILCPPFIMEFLFSELSLHLWLVLISLLRMCYVTFVQREREFYFTQIKDGRV
jgi:hypothetical protein